MNSDSKKAFFQQSGWMIFATLANGVFMFAVHIFAPFMGDTEYGLFGTLLAIMNLMLIPGLGLQPNFAQQTAAAASKDDQEQLAAAVQSLLKGTFFIWLAMVVLAVVFHKKILSELSISNPMALWMTLAVGLGQLWLPILLGVLQGQQNFAWLGWATIINGVGRFLVVAVIVLVFGGKATGAVLGAWVGLFAAVLLGAIHSRSVWLRPRLSGKFQWRNWLVGILPLTLGLGATQVMFSVDMIVVRSLFGEAQTGYYSFAGMIGRGLVIFTAPLTVVMFPKIVHSLSLGKKSNVLLYTLLGTLILGAIAAVGCTLAALAVKNVATSSGEISYLPSAFVAQLRQPSNSMGIQTLTHLIPWFVWCMLPLAMANVLLNNLVARKSYRVVLYVVAVALAYLFVVRVFGTSFVRVVQILGIFNLIYLAVLSIFTWKDTRLPQTGI